MFNPVVKFKVFTIGLTIYPPAFVLLSTVELIYLSVRDMISSSLFLFKLDKLFEIFGVFMSLIPSTELFESKTETYLKEGFDLGKVVLAVTMISITRKVTILDVKVVSSLTMLGFSRVVLALSIGYYLSKIRKPYYAVV